MLSKLVNWRLTVLFILKRVRPCNRQNIEIVKPSTKCHYQAAAESQSDVGYKSRSIS